MEENKFQSGQYYIEQSLRILNIEKELESMIQDNILDILVDGNGEFYYQITDKYFNSLVDSKINVKRESRTFFEICLMRGIDQTIAHQYNTTIRQKNL